MMSSVESSLNQNLATSTEAQQTPRVGAVVVETPKLKFNSTFSRADLQAIPAKRRLEAIQGYVDNYQIYQSVYNAAATGKTSYLHVIPANSRGCKSYPPAYEVTPDDIVEGLRAKFPGCDVLHSEEWVDIGPDAQVRRKGIKIDWS
jgi:hypothetical protein